MQVQRTTVEADLVQVENHAAEGVAPPQNQTTIDCTGVRASEVYQRYFPTSLMEPRDRILWERYRGLYFSIRDNPELQQQGMIVWLVNAFTSLAHRLVREGKVVASVQHQRQLQEGDETEDEDEEMSEAQMKSGSLNTRQQSKVLSDFEINGKRYVCRQLQDGASSTMVYHKEDLSRIGEFRQCVVSTPEDTWHWESYGDSECYDPCPEKYKDTDTFVQQYPSVDWMQKEDNLYPPSFGLECEEERIGLYEPKRPQDDEFDSEESAPEDEEPEAQGRKGSIKHTQALQRYSRRMKGRVYEFGTEMYLSRPQDLQLYLEYMDNWLTELRLPSDLTKQKRMIGKWKANKPHRTLAVKILAMNGNAKAKYINAMISGRDLPEAQSGIGMIMAGLLWDGVTGKVRQLANRVERAEKAIGVANVVADVSKTVTQAAKTVWKWLKDLWRQVCGLFEKGLDFLRAHFLKVLLGVAAFSYARTLFAKKDQPLIRHYIMYKLGVPAGPIEIESEEAFSEAQSDGPLRSTLEFMRVNFFKARAKDFWNLMCGLPKCVSIANAIIWIIDHIEDLINTALELWTGQVRGRTKMEREILAFQLRVEEFNHKVKHSTIAEFFSTEMDTLRIFLINERRRLELAITDKQRKDLRPFFSLTFSRNVSEFAKGLSDWKARTEAAQERPLPIWLYISGPMNIGKTTAMKKIQAMVWKYVQTHSDIWKDMGPFHLGLVFDKNEFEEYWDAYHGQPIVQIDDLFQVKDGQCRMTMSGELIHMVTTVPRFMRVADLDKKGHVHFTSRFLTTTTNLPGFADLFSGKTAFKGENTGLVDIAALESRRALSVRMVSHNPPQFELEPGYSCTFGNKLTMEQVAAVCGEAIIAEDQRSKIPYDPPEIPRYTGTLVGPRVCVNEHKLTFKSIPDVKLDDFVGQITVQRDLLVFDDDDKGKEKEIELSSEEESQAEGDGPDAEPVFEGSSDMELGPTRNPFSRLNDYRIYNKLPEFVLRQLGPGILPPLIFQESTGYSFEDWCRKTRERLYDYTTGEYTQRINRFLLVTSDDEPRWDMWMDSLRKEYEFIYYPNGAPFDYAGWFPIVHFMDVEFGPRVRYDIPYLVDVMEDARTKVSVVTKITAVAGVCGLSLIVLKKLFDIALPRAAYEAQLAYPQESMRNASRKFSRRARRRENRRLRLGERAKAQSAEEAFQVISQNDDIIEVRGGPKGSTWDDVKDSEPFSCHVLFVGNRMALVPEHILHRFPEKDTEVYVSLVKHVSMHFKIEELGVVDRYPGDYVLVDFPNITQRRSILGHFDDDENMYGRAVLLECHNQDTGYNLKYATTWENKVEETVMPDGYTFETDLVFYDIPNKRGMCGLPYCRENGSIVGLHNAGKPRTMVGLATRIMRSDLAKHFAGKPVIAKPLTAELSEANCLRGVIVLGRLQPRDGVYIPTETKHQRSLFDISDFPCPETEDGPAKLKPEGGQSPLENAKAAFGLQERVPMDEPLSDLSGCLPSTFDRNMIGVIPLEDALFGIEGYLKALDRKTSAGYFFKKMGLTREKLWWLDAEGQRHVHPLLVRMVEQRMEELDKNIVRPTVFECVLKDEIRSKEKIEAFKTRLFDSGDLVSLVIQRMFFATLMVEMTKDPTGTPFGLGVNPHSREWGELYSYLRNGGLNVVVNGGDFTYYDISVKNEFKKEFERLVVMVHPDPRAPLVLMGNEVAWHIMGTLVYLRPWGTDSGEFLTALFNSYANWVVHKRAFRALYSEKDFSAARSTFTGDDSVITVPQQFKDFHMEYLEKYFWRVYRMRYTSPDKTVRKTMTWEDLTYLKRRFVIGHAGVMAPLAQRSIANMVKWSYGVPTAETMESICRSVLLEAWHYGPEFYERCLKWCNKEAKRMGYPWVFLDWTGMCLARKADY